MLAWQRKMDPMVAVEIDSRYTCAMTSELRRTPQLFINIAKLKITLIMFYIYVKV